MQSSLFEKQHDSAGCVGVQPRRGLVQEEQGRGDNQLHADVTPLPLAARHTTDKLVTNLVQYNTFSIC